MLALSGRLLKASVDIFLFCVGDDSLAISVNGIVATAYLFLETVVEACLPDVDDFVRPSRDEVVSLPTEPRRIGVGL